MKKLLFALAPILATNALAQSVSDYWGFSVRLAGSTWLYGYTSESTRTTVRLGLVPSGSKANHLATDVDNNRLIYAVMDTAGNITGIEAYSFYTRTSQVLTNGADLAGMIGQTSGGASFYNGNYYFWDDDGDTQGLVKFTFDGDGLIDTMTKPYGNDTTLGGLGDIAIDGAGIMFALNTANQLYSLDLNNPLAALSYIGDYSAYVSNGQLFIDEEGRLISFQSSTGNWVSLDPNGSGILETITGDPNAVNQLYDDLSEGRSVGIVVPEPTGALLVTLSGACALLRRRRVA